MYCPINPPSLGTNPFSSTVHFIVPPYSYLKYVSSWSNYASQIYALYVDSEIDSELTGTISFSGSGAGTENDPFLIFNPVQLNDVRNSVGHSGVYYKLMSDIDMTEWIAENNPTQGWQPIGNNTAMFKGVFIGNGKRITGLTSNRPTSSYVGLFGYVYNSTISDLTVEGSIIGGEYTGGLFGKCKHSTISNCSFEGNVKGAGNTGGFAGATFHSTFTTISQNGEITGGGNNVGGVFGEFVWSEVDSANHSGNISYSGQNTGGLIGRTRIGTDGICTAFTGATKVINSKTTGDVKSQSSYVGGLFGLVETRTAYSGIDETITCKATITHEITNCSHKGEVSGTNYVGGIAGDNILEQADVKNTNSGTTAKSLFTDCSHTGNMTATDSKGGGIIGVSETYDTHSSATIQNCHSEGDLTVAGAYGGGVMGWANNGKTTITDCHSVGKLTVGGSYAGGVLGCSTAGSVTTISGCHSVGDITVTGDYAGGVLGYSSTSTTTISGSYSVGDLTVSGANAGGVLGYSSTTTTTISDCYSLGDLTVTGDYAGGILGRSEAGKTTITDSYYNGKIESKQYAGGIIGKATNTSIKYSYSNSSLINGTNYVGGIAGHLDGTSSISSSVSASEQINATVNYVGRIYGAADSGAELGATGSLTENKGLATATVNLSGVQQILVDGLQHGTNVGRSTLRLRSTYQGIGWDFTNKWANQETESYPYKPVQTAPPVIQSVSRSGDTTISGKAANDATVYVTVNGKTLTTTALNNAWSVTVDPMQPGNVISVYAIAPEFEASYSVYQTVGFAGNGTLEDPYQIYTADDLANVNGKGYYKIMNDIDLSEWIATNSPKSGWEPIGKKGSIMSNLIGDNHVISGLWVDSTDDYVGLLSMAENISITDLTVKVADGKSIKGNDYVSILIGKVVNSSISGCHVVGTVKATGNYIGGIVGNAEKTSISGCQVTGTLEATGNYIGGMAGNASQGAIENCTANGVTISGADYAGGLVGKSDAISFTDCSADCIINAKKYVGGLTGIANAAITNSQTNVDITGTNYLGGLCGTTTETITNSFASGTISGTNSNTDVCYAGGLVGHSTKDITLSYSKLSVELMSQGTECYVGGITGYNDGALIENCYSTGLTSSSQYAAGITGYNKGQVSKCYASGSINAFLYGAGIVGYNDGETATTSNCVALNNVIAVSDEAGIAMRVIGGFKNGAPTPEANNIALKTMVVSVNDVTQKIYDDLLHGVGNTLDVLEQGATYTSLDWDFDKIWAIEESVGYPYLKSSPTEVVLITSLNLAQSEVTLEVSGTLTITATIEPANATTKELEWTSSNESVATVADGVVTAISAGTATITARTTDGTNLSATCEITVLEKVTNYFAAKDFKIRPGASYSFPVEMINENEIAGFQCDIYLPEGISIDVVDGEYDIALTDRMVDHVLFSALQADGAVRMLSYSMKVKSYTGNSGDLFTVNLTASSDYDGLGTIKISNILVSTPKEVEYKCPDVEVNVELQSYTLGDVNNDGSVSVTDVISATNYILGSPSSNFIFEAADITGDGKIGVGDVIGIVNRVLNVGTLSTQNASTITEDSLEAEDIQIEAGETKTVSLNLSNAEVYTGFQFDVKLPNGMKFENAYLPKLADTHRVAFKQREDGSVRVVVFSLTNEDIKQNLGSLLSFDVAADNSFAGGEIEISNVLFANKETQEFSMSNLPIEASQTGGIDNVAEQTSIYVENNRIVVIVPESQIVTISSVTGISASYEVTAGKNILPVSQSGLYIVKLDNIVKKLIIK